MGPDVIVVGGGVIGAACADELARRGLRVTLFERRELASAASGRNQGLFLFPTDPPRLAMARLSLERYLELAGETELPIRLDREPIGVIHAAEEEDLLDGDGFADLPVPGDRLGPEALRELEPELAPDLAGGWLLEDGRRVVPSLLTVALAHRARGRGAEIRHHRPVRALLLEGDRVRGVATDDGVLLADTVVLAAGPWSPDLVRPLGVRLPVAGGRGWLLRVEPTRPLLSRLLEDAGRFPSGTEPVGVGDLLGGWPAAAIGAFCHPSWDGSMLVGSSREAALADLPNDPSVPSTILRRATRFVPALSQATVLATWHGVRPISPDERPIVGTVADGLVVATGHGAEGVILGAGTAALVGALVAGEEPPLDPAPFDPSRF